MLALGQNADLSVLEGVPGVTFYDGVVEVGPDLMTGYPGIFAGGDMVRSEARRCMSCGNCFGCDNCYGVCPDNTIIKLGDGQHETDYDYRKGCGLCAAECPAGAIEIVPEPS